MGLMSASYTPVGPNLQGIKALTWAMIHKFQKRVGRAEP